MADVEAAIQEMFQAPHIQVSPEGTPCSVILIFILVDGGISCRLHDNKEELAFFFIFPFLSCTTLNLKLVGVCFGAGGWVESEC